jgi:hypothetical protein
MVLCGEGGTELLVLMMQLKHVVIRLKGFSSIALKEQSSSYVLDHYFAEESWNCMPYSQVGTEASKKCQSNGNIKREN